MRRRPILLGLLALLSSTLVAGAAMPAGAGSKPPAVPPAISCALRSSRDWLGSTVAW